LVWADENHVNVLFQDYNGAEDQYDPNFFPGVTQEIFEKARVLRFLLAAGCSETDYAKYFTSSPLMKPDYHKTLKNYKKSILRILRPLVTLKTLGVFSNEKIEFVTPKDVVSLWMNFPEMRNQIIEVNEKYTLPYIGNLNNRIQTLTEHRQNPEFKFNSIMDGSEWLNVLERTKSLWEPRLKSDGKNLFLHLSLFHDGFRTSRTTKDKGHEAFIISVSRS
jgi:hypothetical protein